jgi:uncharacterized protein (DUF952 family)
MLHAKDIKDYFVLDESEMDPPTYLYKILSISSWEESKTVDHILIPKEDEKFIHLSKADQLERILSKYWTDKQVSVILKLDTSLLRGDLRYETNKGGLNKYYHLYDGLIPHLAIVKHAVIAL